MLKRLDPTLTLLTLYLVGFLVSFGPATVESERAEIAHEATCAPQPICKYGGPMMSDGTFKALFWPLWLSYTLADSYMSPDPSGV